MLRGEPGVASHRRRHLALASAVVLGGTMLVVGAARGADAAPKLESVSPAAGQCTFSATVRLPDGIGAVPASRPISVTANGPAGCTGVPLGNSMTQFIFGGSATMSCDLAAGTGPLTVAFSAPSASSFVGTAAISGNPLGGVLDLALLPVPQTNFTGSAEFAVNPPGAGSLATDCAHGVLSGVALSFTVTGLFQFASF